MIETERLRVRAFENSDATALIAARVPPIPSPVITRYTERTSMLFAVVARNIPAAMTMRQPRMVTRRPIRSATPPRRIEPSAIPASSIDWSQPSAVLLGCHSEAIPGEANAIESTSKPSSALRPIVITTAVICSQPMRARARISRGSVFTVACPQEESPGFDAGAGKGTTARARLPPRAGLRSRALRQERAAARAGPSAGGEEPVDGVVAGAAAAGGVAIATAGCGITAVAGAGA